MNLRLFIFAFLSALISFSSSAKANALGYFGDTLDAGIVFADVVVHGTSFTNAEVGIIEIKVIETIKGDHSPSIRVKIPHSDLYSWPNDCIFCLVKRSQQQFKPGQPEFEFLQWNQGPIVFRVGSTPHRFSIDFEELMTSAQILHAARAAAKSHLVAPHHQPILVSFSDIHLSVPLSNLVAENACKWAYAYDPRMHSTAIDILSHLHTDRSAAALFHLLLRDENASFLENADGFFAEYPIRLAASKALSEFPSHLIAPPFFSARSQLIAAAMLIAFALIVIFFCPSRFRILKRAVIVLLLAAWMTCIVFLSLLNSQSHLVTDDLLFTLGSKTFSLTSHRRALQLQWTDRWLPAPAPFIHQSHALAATNSNQPTRFSLFLGPSNKMLKQWAGFTWAKGVSQGITIDSPAYALLRIPYWSLILLLCLPLLPIIHRLFLHYHRKSKGLCPNCGYDLRATPTQCPECGSITKNPLPAIS